MKRARCAECGLERNRVIAIAQLQDFSIESVCVPCYKRLGYYLFFDDETNERAGIPPKRLWREGEWS